MFTTPEARAEAREVGDVKPEGRISLWSKLQSEKNPRTTERWDIDNAGERTTTLPDGTVIDVVTGAPS